MRVNSAHVKKSFYEVCIDHQRWALKFKYTLRFKELYENKCSGVNITQNIWWFEIFILTLRCNYYTRARLIWKKTSIATAIRIRRSQLIA